MNPRAPLRSRARYDIDLDETARAAALAGAKHSHLPVFRRTPDAIEGVIEVATGKIEDALFVPETVTLDDLLATFAKSRKQLAVVLDEYGGTAGIITPNDILELIVGPGVFANPDEEPAIVRKGPNVWEIDARASIDEINRALDIELEAEDADRPSPPCDIGASGGAEACRRRHGRGDCGRDRRGGAAHRGGQRMIVVLLILAAVAMLALTAFCAGAETAFLSVSRERILHLAREGGKKAKVVQKALAAMPRTMTTLLIGSNLASVAYSCAMAELAEEFFQNRAAASALWSFSAAFTILYVAEFLPKMLCAARPLRRVLTMAPAYRVLNAVLRPLTALGMKLTDLFVPRKEAKSRLTSADLLRILQDRKDGVCLSDIESALITRIVVLRVKSKPITPEAILSALREDEATE